MNKVKEKPIRLPKLEICPLCGGSGLIDNGNETKECPLCKGEKPTNNNLEKLEEG